MCPAFPITVHSPCLIPTHAVRAGIFKTFNTQSARVPLREEERKLLSRRALVGDAKAGPGLRKGFHVIALIKGRVELLCFQGEGRSL